MTRDFPAGVDHLFGQFGIGRMSNVFFLDCGVDDYFFLLDFRIEEVDGQLEKTFRTFLANPFTKMSQV